VPDDDPLTDAELEFIRFYQSPRRWRQWCEERRADWLRAHPPKPKPKPARAPQRRTPGKVHLPKWQGIVDDEKE
jgi:hypothetical protein